MSTTKTKGQSNAPFPQISSQMMKLFILILTFSVCQGSFLENYSQTTQNEQEIKKLQESIPQSMNFFHIESESFGQDYEINLQKVVSQLDSKWKEWFKFEAHQRSLRISKPPSLLGGLQDKELGVMFKDIILSLEENNLLSLFGLEIICQDCYNMGIQASKSLANLLSTESLHLQSLHLSFRKEIVHFFLQDLPSHLIDAISIQAPSLQSLHLDFHNAFGMKEAFKNLPSVLSHQSLRLQSLHLDFTQHNIAQSTLTDLAAAISTQIPHLQSLHLNFDGDSACKALIEMMDMTSAESLPLQFLNLGFTK